MCRVFLVDQALSNPQHINVAGHKHLAGLILSFHGQIAFQVHLWNKVYMQFHTLFEVGMSALPFFNFLYCLYFLL